MFSVDGVSVHPFSSAWFHVVLEIFGMHRKLWNIQWRCALIALPTQVFPDKFVKYSVYYAFFALQLSRRSYLLLTEADYSRCDKRSITICSAETAVYNSQSLTCESSHFR